MKKIFCLTLTLLMLISLNCFAMIEKNQVEIGGIKLLDSYKLVKKIYGEPNKIESRVLTDGASRQISKGSILYNWYYGDSFEIEFIVMALKPYRLAGKDFDDIIVGISSSKNNGIKTADGVSVGMKSDILWTKYGIPDKLSDDNSKKYFRYTCYTGFTYEYLNFTVENGIITKMSMGGEY